MPFLSSKHRRCRRPAPEQQLVVVALTVEDVDISSEVTPVSTGARTPLHAVLFSGSCPVVLTVTTAVVAAVVAGSIWASGSKSISGHTHPAATTGKVEPNLRAPNLSQPPPSLVSKDRWIAPLARARQYGLA
jgi:hypothetical protein